jgi:hypothetical protein
MALNFRLNDELERIWKEAVEAQSRYPGICLKGLRRTTKTLFRMAGVWTEIQGDHLLNTGLGRHYHFAVLLSAYVICVL